MTSCFELWIPHEQKVIRMVERDALGHPFLNLNNYSQIIEGKLNWKNKLENKKLNIRN